ncbi:Putative MOLYBDOPTERIN BIOSYNTHESIS PROTEIN MOEY [Minicystis rosea]|nr:Putative MOLYBDOPTERIN BIOSYNTHESIS PROTEIN MOEY [Minicystis rosea]
MNLESKLAGLREQAADQSVFRPVLFDLTRADDRRALEALVDRGAIAIVNDALDEQLGELLAGRTPSQKLKQPEIDARVREHLGDRELSSYGTWVLYPWSRRLVHVLPEPEFRELRHSRNRYKIKPDEQDVVATKRIGVIGLSVGQASAVTLAQEGIGRAYRLADFDRLSLSNMNRLRTSVDAINVPKVVIAAREMFEIDPYLSIEVWPEGLTEANLDVFLTGGGKLDLLVEECDDLFMKVLARERAKALRIAVIMDTNERGMMDVERFDLEPERPLLHGLLAGIGAEDVKRLKTRDKVPYMVRILGQDLFSARFVPSLMEIDETIGSWPQLASGVALGAALVTDVARRILLDQFRGSGRYFVDLDELIKDGANVTLAPPEPLDAPVSPLALEPLSLELPNARGELSREDIRRIVAHGMQAPSGGNIQPWRFQARGTTLRCFVDEKRAGVMLDWDWRGTYLAMGAAVENMALAAGAAGIDTAVRPFPEPGNRGVVADVTFSIAGRKEASPLVDFITRRATNRKLGKRVELPAEQREALREAAAAAGGRLQVVTDPRQLDVIGHIVGSGDRVRFLSKRLHGELMGEVRWTPEEVESTRDGIDLKTLELSRTDLAATRLSRSWNNILFLREIGGGRALEKSGRDAIEAASAVCFLTHPGASPEGYFRGGRALERVWLTATKLGLAVQPVAGSVYLWTRIEHGGGEGLAPDEIATLRAQRVRFREIFEVPSDVAEVMMFRVAVADPPSARSLRRSVDDVLVFEDG